MISRWTLLHFFLRCVIIATIFITGVASGVYYHNELTVVTRHLLGITPPLEAEIPPQPKVESSTDNSEEHSVLELATVPEPLPLVYSATLVEEHIQEDLKRGAVVLPLGTAFGQKGNVVVTAHSSGSAAFGPYRFAFSQLSEIEDGEEFKVRTPQAIYTYRVYGREVVWPHEVDKLPKDDRSTVTLVTCWPLWTNFKRLLVHAELVDTDYNTTSLSPLP